MKRDLQKQLDELYNLSTTNTDLKDFRRFDVCDLNEFFASNRLDLKYWKPLYILNLIRFGFNVESATKLFQFGRYGHCWEKLWPTEEEKNLTEEKMLDHFYRDLDYCSDRMNFDRLFRIHFFYNLIQQSFHEQDN